MNNNLLHYLDNTAEYRIKLMSDVELEKYASVILNKQLSSNSVTFSLESEFFGSGKNSECGICHQTKQCPGHYGLIALPYPIVTNTIIMETFYKLIQLLCPCCANFPIENAKDALNLRPEDRFAFIRSEVTKKQKSVTNVCPYCNNTFIFITVEDSFPNAKFMFKQEIANKSVQISPLYIYSLINNISDQTAEYAGFNLETNNPRNYMTKFITVIPNRLRIKTIDSQASSVTSSYKIITETLLPELDQIYRASISNSKIIPTTEDGKKFNALYAQLNARYCMFLDMTKDSMTNACLATLSKRDKKHLEPSASMIGRLKDKESSYFEKGIISTRHNCSARTVLGGDNNIHSYEIGFPKKYCNKMGIFIPVYSENLELCKQFVASMSEVNKHDHDRIKVNKIRFVGNNQLHTVKPDNAIILASRVQPGDKLFISLIPGSIVQHIRFPSVREESYASHLLVPTSHTCMTLPLAACDYKNADFDGDETGIYASYSNVTDPECLLLNSIFRQIINYKFGNVGVLFQGCDSKVEIPLLKANTLIGVREVHDPDTDSVVYRETFFPPRTVGDFVEEYLNDITGNSENSHYPKIAKINYSDSETIIKDNKLIDNDKSQLNNQSLFLYLCTTIGADRTLELIDHIIQLGYNYSYYKPITLGNEIRYYTPESKKEVLKIHEDCYQAMKKIEQSNKPQKDKDREIYTMGQKQSEPILKILKEGGKGTNIDSLRFLRGAALTGYYKMLVNMDPALPDGSRVQNKLSNHTRTCISYPQYSTDPIAYGYAPHGYGSNEITVTETFYDCMMQRHGMYVKGNGVAKQGYLQKRFLMSFGQNTVDANGAQIFDGRVVSPCYGCASLNPRYVFKQPLKDISLSPEEFKKKYSIPKLIELYDIINDASNIYNYVTCFAERKIYDDTFIAGYDYEQMFKNSNIKPGKTDEAIIDEFIENLRIAFAPKGMKQRFSLLNLVQTEYYFRQKAAEFELSRDVLIDAYYHFLNSLVDAGEPVGMKAALGIGESLTQESLDAIHHASGGSIDSNRLEFTRSGDRFEELVGGASHKHSVITIGFYNATEEAVKAFAKREETIYFSNIWTKLETVISGNISEKVKVLHPKIADLFDKIEVSKTFVKMIWNLSVLADLDIKISDVYETLYKNFPQIAFITGNPVNSKEYLAYIYFNANMTNAELDNYIQLFKSQVSQSIIHGDCVVNCYVTQNKNTGEWIMKCNEVNKDVRAFEKIIYRPEVDPAKCFTTNTRLILDLYGVFETGPRICEELLYCATELSSVGDLPTRHFKTIGLGCITSGQYFVAVSNSAIKSDIDYLRGCNFEQPSAFIKKAISKGTFRAVEDPVAGAFFADLPKLGSGYVKSQIFKV